MTATTLRRRKADMYGIDVGVFRGGWSLEVLPLALDVLRSYEYSAGGERLGLRATLEGAVFLDVAQVCGIARDTASAVSPGSFAWLVHGAGLFCWDPSLGLLHTLAVPTAEIGPPPAYWQGHLYWWEAEGSLVRLQRSRADLGSVSTVASTSLPANLYDFSMAALNSVAGICEVQGFNGLEHHDYRVRATLAGSATYEDMGDFVAIGHHYTEDPIYMGADDAGGSVGFRFGAGGDVGLQRMVDEIDALPAPHWPTGGAWPVGGITAISSDGSRVCATWGGDAGGVVAVAGAPAVAASGEPTYSIPLTPQPEASVLIVAKE